MMDLISLTSRTDFQEYLVGWTLREINTLFRNYELEPKELNPEELPSGERRGLIAKYYANIDWADPKHIRKMTSVYADILERFSDRINDSTDDYYHNGTQQKADQQLYSRLVRGLERSGFTYAKGKLTVARQTTIVELEHEAIDLCDPHQFQEYVDRINSSIESDPALAIGSAKELVESVLKTVLIKLDEESFDKNDDVPKLLKKVQRVLKLAPNEIDNAVQGADIIRVLLNNLGSVVIKLAELRNFYGTGHGLEKKRKGLELRHARLAVGAGITLSSFLLDTFKSRSSE